MAFNKPGTREHPQIFALLCALEPLWQKIFAPLRLCVKPERTSPNHCAPLCLRAFVAKNLCAIASLREPKKKTGKNRSLI
jgi:hypothetical protein